MVASIISNFNPHAVKDYFFILIFDFFILVWKLIENSQLSSHDFNTFFVTYAQLFVKYLDDFAALRIAEEKTRREVYVCFKVYDPLSKARAAAWMCFT